MRAHPAFNGILVSAVLSASAAAQSAVQIPKSTGDPVGPIPTSVATAALVDSKLDPDETISVKRLPSVAELMTIAGAHGLVVEKIVLSNAEITAVYRSAGNQLHTVCYQFPPIVINQPQPLAPMPAPAVFLPAPAPAPVPEITPVVVSQPAISPMPVPADGYVAYYDPVCYPGYYPWPYSWGTYAGYRSRSHGHGGYGGWSSLGGASRGGSYSGGVPRNSTSRGGTSRGSGSLPGRL